MINTVLFDLDGTLIDTNELIIQSFLHTLNHYYPEKYSRTDVIRFIGPSLHETFSEIDLERTEELTKHYRAFNLQKHDTLTKEFDTVYDTVKKLHERGYKLAIVTTKIRHTTMMGLKLANLTPFFNCIVTFDDVRHVKPSPEPLFLALKKLQAKSSEAIMVGDNHQDILAGKNAHVQTAAAGWTVKGKAYLEQYDPDVVLEKMSDLLSYLEVK